MNNTCAGNEAKSVISWLRILPEMNVGVVENVCVQPQVVEGLGGEHHANIVAQVKQRDGFDVEVCVCQLISIKNAHLRTQNRITWVQCNEISSQKL